MGYSTPRPAAPGYSAPRHFWKAALCCAVLAVAATASASTQARNPKPPPLFAEQIGQPLGQLPEQAIAGKSHTVKINHANLLSGRLMLNLPGGMTVGAMRDRQEDLGNGRFAWVGHAIGNRAERVILGVSGDAVAGIFSRKGKLFKLEPRADGTHVLSEVDTAEPAPELDPIALTETDLTVSGGLSLGDTAITADDSLTLGSPASAADSGPAIIDVLVAYTPGVRDYYGQNRVEAPIILAVAETNQAYANSGITQRINLVFSVLTEYTEDGDAEIDLNRLTDTSDGQMDELHALRDSYGADQVVLLIQGGKYCGFAHLLTSLNEDFAARAFSIVRHDCATGYYTFAHELGHNQGAHHDKANSGDAIHEYAHGYQDPSSGFRTVMAYPCGGCTRVDHFSNPAVYYRGVPTGDATDSNNARTLNKTAAKVAGFRAQLQQQRPQAPYELEAAAASDSEIRLNWREASADETGFYLERSDANQNFVQRVTLPANTTSYLDNNLQAETFYSYRIQSFNSAGSSSYSNTAIIATDPAPVPIPNAPSGLAATTAGRESISLAWVDNSSNEAGFTLQRSPNGSSGWTYIARLAANVTSYFDTGLQPKTLYYYRVRAFNDSGESATSISSASTDDLPVSKYVRQRDVFR